MLRYNLMTMAPARWTVLLREALEQSMKESGDSISYAIASNAFPSTPSVRFVVHRGFVNERR